MESLFLKKRVLEEPKQGKHNEKEKWRSELVITTQGMPRNYIKYATTLLRERERCSSEVMFCNLTIFNKNDFHLDKEIEVVFNHFQNGVSLVKSDKMLFKGLFYIAIKDVDLADVVDLKDEFCLKLLQICKRLREFFLTKTVKSIFHYLFC